jgi:hypothetical protein
MVKVMRWLAPILVTASMLSADYLFPSANPPGGKKAANVKQYVVFTWDDNGYSGKKGTQYEATPGATYAASSWVGGVVNEGGWMGPKPNTLNLQEGDMGVTWGAITLAGHTATKYLKWNATAQYSANKDTVIYNDSIWFAAFWPPVGAKPAMYDTAKVTSWERYWKLVSPVSKELTRKNPDGSPLHFTFNIITGLLVPVWPVEWTSRESKLGYWVPTDKDYPSGQPLHTKIAVAWGREQEIRKAEGGEIFQEGYLQESFAEAIGYGHEIGNHTIDHMESNSPLPNTDKGFGAWGGEGFDATPNDTMPWGEVIDEAAMYGQKIGASAQTMGWKINSGKYISKTAWKGAISVGEQQLSDYLGISRAKNNCFGFRAPRLEAGSGLFYALKELGYQYDCGLEEGYEPDMDGTNAPWPYTTDNGSPSTAYAHGIGEQAYLDSMPAGVWELPSDAIIVPPEIRQAVYDNYKQIATAAPDGGEAMSFEDWVSGGAKISAYDFNLWVLWGMTKANWLTTMKWNLDQRLAHNKAPFHYAAHTDYYTPIYDNATLLNDFNKSSYGLNVSKGWNTWLDRKNATAEFVDYAISKGCFFVSAHELIEAIKEMGKGEVFGRPANMESAKWEFYSGSTPASTATQASFTGDILNASVSMPGASGENPPVAGYRVAQSTGYFSGMTHVSLTYQTSAPLTLRLVLANDNPWEVTLNNIGPEVESGKIPLSAFHYNMYDTEGKNAAVNPDDIEDIEIEFIHGSPQARTQKLSVKNLILWGAKGATPMAVKPRAALAAQGIDVRGLTRSQLSLRLERAGNYSVEVVAPNGRLVASFDNAQLKAGENCLKLNNITSGMYFVNIRNGAAKMSIRRIVM